MNNRKLRSGSKQDIAAFLDNVQSDVASNITNRIKQLFGNFGLLLDIQAGSDIGNNFVTTVQGSSNEQLNINSGKAITSSGEFINFQGSTKDWSAEQLSAGTYVVKLQYTLLGSDPVTVMNAFLFDQTGGEDFTDRKTKFSDGSVVALEAVGVDIDATIAGLASNEVALAIVKVLGDFTFDTTSWSFDSQTAVGGVIDIREENRLGLNSALFDDSKFIFKDRNSTGSYAITGDVEFASNLYHDTILPISGQSASITTNIFTTDQIVMSSGNETNTNIAGTSASTFTINGNPALTGDGSLTTPTNLRIYDINPTNTKDEAFSFVELRWNWDDLNGEPGGTSSEYVIYDSSFGGETINLSGGNVVGKYLYFSNSDNEYEITNVTSGSGEFTLTVNGTIDGGDAPSSGSPARIIDHNVKEYLLSVRNTANNFSYIHNLNATYRKSPKFTQKLELGVTWAVSLQAQNTGSSSSTVNMQAGSYDPDHAGGGQSSVNYNSNFTNQLPDISSTGSISLRADAQGFLMDITGWNVGGNPTNTAHEFEVIYSAETDLDDSHFDSLNSGGIEHRILKSNTAHFSSGRPTKYSVGVRPLQNRQGVDSGIFKEVVSGGGGVLPTEQVIVGVDANIQVIKTVVSGVVDSQYVDVVYQDDVSDPLYWPATAPEGRWFTKLDGAGEPIDNDDYRARQVRDYSNTGVHRVDFGDTSAISATDEFKSGVSKSDRFIAERALDVDMRVTKIEFSPAVINGTSASDPGIIRVYQRGLENSAVTMEVEGYQGEPVTQATDLPIQLASDGTRNLIVDAWDPDVSDPNNDCTIAGRVNIIGKPIIVNELD